MASVWSQQRGAGEPQKVVGHLQPAAALARCRQMAYAWRAKYGPAVEVWSGEWLLYTDGAAVKAGRPVGSLFVELLSPPSAPERGQPERPRQPPGASRSAHPRG
jgi:hypothetical protein